MKQAPFILARNIKPKGLAKGDLGIFNKDGVPTMMDYEGTEVAIGGSSSAAALTLADASARKDADNYPGGLQEGVTVVEQADDPTTLWLYFGGDVSLDASWRALPRFDGDGNILAGGVAVRPLTALEAETDIPAYSEVVNVAGTLVVGDGTSTAESLFPEAPSFQSPATLTLIADSTAAVKGYPLTAIPDNWTNYDSTLTGLSLGSQVTSIGSSSFNYCFGFTGSLTIPNSVTTIGSHAFWYCSGFTGSLVIPNSVTSIGSYAFIGTYRFTGSLTIGNSVTSIGGFTFSNCSGFTGSLTIPNSVTSIGSYAFYNCFGFTGSLTIGNSVTSIGSGAFYNCFGFTGSLTIPNSVTSIGSGAFYNCFSTTNVDCYVTRAIMNSDNCLLNSGVTTLHARTSDGTWTVGADTIGGKALTVIKDLT